MPTKIKVSVGDKLIVKNGLQENMLIKEGMVNKITEIAGTEFKRIHCEGPFIIDVEQD